MTAAPAAKARVALDASQRDWAALSVEVPQLAATMRRYLIQLSTFLAPRSVVVADNTLRQFARWLAANTDVSVVASDTPPPQWAPVVVSGRHEPPPSGRGALAEAQDVGAFGRREHAGSEAVLIGRYCQDG